MSLPASGPPSPSTRDPLAKFPEDVRAAHARFLATGDAAALDTVVLAVVLDHQPKAAQTSGLSPVATPADSARLIADLGFDSLALAEIVFFFEDLYGVTITNNELVRITTIGELRAFVRAKVAATRAA
ncbi:MAG: acyl carrier protein [Opitutaceae bacterium]|jgi:acyl carrier protein